MNKDFVKGFIKVASDLGSNVARKMILSDKYKVNDLMKMAPAGERSAILERLREKRK